MFNYSSRVLSVIINNKIHSNILLRVTYQYLLNTIYWCLSMLETTFSRSGEINCSSIFPIYPCRYKFQKNISSLSIRALLSQNTCSNIFLISFFWNIFISCFKVSTVNKNCDWNSFNLLYCTFETMKIPNLDTVEHVKAAKNEWS